MMPEYPSCAGEVIIHQGIARGEGENSKNII